MQIAERDHQIINTQIQDDPEVKKKRQTTTTASNYSNIRIFPFLTDIDPGVASHINNDNDTSLSISIGILESILMVQAVVGNYVFPPNCNEYTSGINKGKCEDPLPSNYSYTCGEFGIVPDEYIGNREVCQSENGPCYLDGSNGTGIQDSDYLLFVSAANTRTY